MQKILLIICIAFISCNEKQTSQSKEQEQPKTSTDTLTQINCYLFTSGRDSYLLKLNQTSQQLSGNMEFRNYEKDKSFGTVKGTQDGDLVKLWYNFSSEGMQSVMEIHFKKSGVDLLRGLGDVDVKSDTTYHADAGKVDFDNGQLFRKINCDQLQFGKN